MNMDIKINLKHIEVGSELIELVFGETTIRFYATYVGVEPLSTLIKSVVSLNDRAAENVDYAKFHIVWHSEPGFLKLNFRKNVITDIVVLKTESDTRTLHNLEIHFNFNEYRNAVIKESLRVLKEYGLKGFNENWCDGDNVFPLNSLLTALGTTCTQMPDSWVVKSDIIAELEALLAFLKK